MKQREGEGRQDLGWDSRESGCRDPGGLAWQEDFWKQRGRDLGRGEAEVEGNRIQEFRWR